MLDHEQSEADDEEESDVNEDELDMDMQFFMELQKNRVGREEVSVMPYPHLGSDLACCGFRGVPMQTFARRWPSCGNLTRAPRSDSTYFRCGPNRKRGNAKKSSHDNSRWKRLLRKLSGQKRLVGRCCTALWP